MPWEHEEEVREKHKNGKNPGAEWTNEDRRTIINERMWEDGRDWLRWDESLNLKKKSEKGRGGGLKEDGENETQWQGWWKAEKLKKKKAHKE